MQRAIEVLAIFLGWIGFVLVLVGIFLPWGRYEITLYMPSLQSEIRWISGLTWVFGSYLIFGGVAVAAGLLSSTVKASKVTTAFLGSGGILIILVTGLFISSYYEKVYIYPEIQDLGIGSFITLYGGIFELVAAFLYALHARASSESQAQSVSATDKTFNVPTKA